MNPTVSRPEKAPSPLDVAYAKHGQTGTAVTLPDEAGALAEIASRDPSIRAAIDELGLDAEADLAAWISEEGLDVVKLWLSDGTSPSALTRDWAGRMGAGRRCRSVLPELVREAVICRRLQEIAPSLHQYGGTARSIRASREHAAFSLEKEFRSIERQDLRQQRTLLRLAIKYFRTLLDEVKWNPELGSPVVACRFGKSVMRLSRIESVSLAELLEARDVLGTVSDPEVIREENVLSFTLEGYLRAFEQSRDPMDLAAAKSVADRVDATGGFENAAILAEYWLRVADTSRNSVHRSKFVEFAKLAIDHASAQAVRVPFRLATLAVLNGVAKSLLQCGSSDALSELSIPFVTRRLGSVDNADTLSVLESIRSELREGVDDGEYIFRDLYAGILSACARSPLLGEDDSIGALQLAIAAREGRTWQNKLSGEQPGIDQCLDRLRLHGITNDENLRQSAVRELLRQVVQYPKSPHALAQLGAQAEEYGPYAAVIPVPAGPLLDPALVRAVRNGDSRTLYEMTARRALATGTLPQRRLGGRGSVVLIEERTGSSQFTLVIKRMARDRLKLDLARSAHLKNVLEGHGLDEFAVIEHIAQFEFPSVGVEKTPWVSVRRHEVGSTLAELMAERGESAHETLVKAARLLAVIHANPFNPSHPTGVRKALKESEVGCWLRNIVPANEALSFFNSWYSLLPPGVPQVERRDAHPHNWLIDEDGRVLALDLDCVGWRPLGYELAQLTEDIAALDPTNEAARRAVVLAYGSELLAQGLGHHPELLMQSYRAGCIARWIRTLTDPQLGEDARLVATQNLEAFASDFENSDEARTFVTHVLLHWSRKSGVAQAEGLEPISVGTRRRLSRAMAHYLRHNPDAPLTRQGWVDAAVVADALKSQGHPITAERVLLVAGALGEKRFEVQGESVRASYGHTREVSIYTEPTPVPKEALYHATSTSNLRSIFEARDGIRPMKRNFVHLSTDVEIALRAAQRRRESTVVTEIDASQVSELFRTPDGTTWLCRRVPIGAVRVLPIHELERRRSTER